HRNELRIKMSLAPITLASLNSTAADAFGHYGQELCCASSRQRGVCNRRLFPGSFGISQMKSRIRLLPITLATLFAIGSVAQVAKGGIEEDRQEFLKLAPQFMPTLNAGRYTEAEKMALRIFAATRRSFSDEPNMMGAALLFLGMAYDHQGRFAEAETVYT